MNNENGFTHILNKRIRFLELECGHNISPAGCAPSPPREHQGEIRYRRVSLIRIGSAAWLACYNKCRFPLRVLNHKSDNCIENAGQWLENITNNLLRILLELLPVVLGSDNALLFEMFYYGV